MAKRISLKEKTEQKKAKVRRGALVVISALTLALLALTYGSGTSQAEEAVVSEAKAAFIFASVELTSGESIYLGEDTRGNTYPVEKDGFEFSFNQGKVTNVRIVQINGAWHIKNIL